jgi:MinD superfamily P-loop ATPase
MNITLLAKKGGVGKSTVSILLYEAFRQAGKSVSIQDWDTQGTSSKSLQLIHGVKQAGKAINASIVIYDTPPSLDHTATANDTRFAAHACNLSYSSFIRPREEANVSNYASGGTRVHLPFLRYT